ncbi:hypothetical protein ACVWWG_003511 [Bradyrhizobium sp. LB7.2]
MAEGLFLNPDAVLGYKDASMSPRRLTPLLLVMTLLAAGDALAQDKGSVTPKPLPPLTNPNDPSIGARELFARKLLPSRGTGPCHRLLRQGLHRRRRADAAQRRQLAGDATVA